MPWFGHISMGAKCKNASVLGFRRKVRLKYSKTLYVYRVPHIHIVFSACKNSEFIFRYCVHLCRTPSEVRHPRILHWSTVKLNWVKLENGLVGIWSLVDMLVFPSCFKFTREIWLVSLHFTWSTVQTGVTSPIHLYCCLYWCASDIV